MLIKLKEEFYKKVLPLIQSKNELSVFSVIDGIMPGTIYVDYEDAPTAALIKTSECNYLAGDVNQEQFKQSVKEKIEFWDTLTPDTNAISTVIPSLHTNKFVRLYTRCHYVLDTRNWNDQRLAIPEGFYLEVVKPETLRQYTYENIDELVDWLDNWGNDEKFMRYGCGILLRNESKIVSWSMSDCAYQKNIAIGIHTDEEFRQRGFAKIVVQEMIRQCISKGYEQVEWLCVDLNQRSRAVAEKSGFYLQNEYASYTPFAPVENFSDLDEAGWTEWALFFEKAGNTEPRLLEECIYTYVKANNPEKTKQMLEVYQKLDAENKNKDITGSVHKFINYLKSKGLATAFK